MSSISHFASSLWQSTSAGMVDFGAGAAMHMSVAASAMADFSRRFPCPKTRWQFFVLSPLYVFPVLAMILSFVPEQPRAASDFVYHGSPIATNPISKPIRHRHGEFYRVLVYFAAGDMLFNDVVPGNFFSDGAVKEDVPGMTEENPILMPSFVTVFDLENLFKVLKVGPSGNRFEGSHSRDTWESILKLSAFPPFNEWKLRELAIVEIEDAFVKDAVPAADRLALGQRLRVAPWVMCAAEELARRDEPLSEDERGTLGDKTSLKIIIINLRSRVWKDDLPQRDRSMYNFWDAVVKEFEDELGDFKTQTPWNEYICASTAARQDHF
ncbi:unnamed protein product [Peniophora sp. CBMAI 1063]|nr:unnamed protein product [Peniophora sp. CBMAI 1063]